ncbi:ketopantoate reductase family protein [Sutcliffiella cohnii]
MKTLIIGSGSMGSLFGGKLKQAGFDVTIFNRGNSHVEAIQQFGLTILKKDGRTSVVNLPVVTNSSDLNSSYDLVVILVKTYATEIVLKQISHTISQETIILTLQNGIGNLEVLETYFPTNFIAVGGAGCGASIEDNGVIAHNAWGTNFIGSSNRNIEVSQLDEIAQMFTDSGLSTKLSEDVESVIWSKLMVNVSYNALTAITRLRNGDIVLPLIGRNIVRKLVEEAVNVATAKGVHLSYMDPVEECIQIGLTKIGRNKSSMLLDILNKRRTEIDVINGAIVTYGDKFSVPTPYNEMVTNIIKLIETSYPKIVESV